MRPLTADSYDGDDADQTAAPTKTDPEPQDAAEEDYTKPDTESMPVIAGSSSGAADAYDDSAFNNAEHDGEGMDGMHDMGDYNDSRAEERPIGIKEDG